MGLKDNKKKHQAHGLTVGAMEDLRDTEPEMISANMKSGYQIKSHEVHLVHASVENKFFDNKTGKKKSIPKVQTYYQADFERMIKERAFEGLDIEILHDPRRVEAKAQLANSKQQNLKSLTEDDLRNVYFAEIGDVPSPDASVKQLISDIEDFRKAKK